MTDSFSDLVMPIFREVIDLKDRLSWRQDLPNLEQVKQKTHGWIDAVEKKAQGDQVLANDFELAKYGFVAWIDEVLTDSKWGQSHGWGDNQQILEWDFYQTNLRAERFFERAEEAYAALERSQCSTDPLEVYLLCVALGFEGDLKYNQDRHQKWVDRIYSKVSEASPMASRPFPDDSPGDSILGLEPRRGPELLLKVSILSALTALVTLIAYLVSVHLLLPDRT